VIDTATTLGKVDTLSTTTLSVVAASPSPKFFNAAGFHLVADGPVDNPDTYIEDSDSIIVKPLNVLQLLNNNHLTV
jgi:hypothetical protein